MGFSDDVPAPIPRASAWFTMVTPTDDCPVHNIDALMASKSSIEDEIESQATILRINNSTLDSPLTDGDGFPRADVDVWAVRHARVKIIRLRNDLSSLMDNIAIALGRVHASQTARAGTDVETSLHSLLPFAKVDAVAPNGPAQLAVSLHLTQSCVNLGNLIKGLASWGSRHEIWPTDSRECQRLPPSYRTAGGTQ